MRDSPRSQTKSQVTFASLLGESVALLNLRISNHRWPKHFHDHFVIATTLGGAGQLRTERGRFLAGSDDIFMFNPSEVHDGGSRDPSEWNYLSLQITIKAMSNLFRVSLDKDPPEIVFPVTCTYDREISSLLKRLHLIQANSADQLAQEEQLIRLTSALFSRHLDTGGESLAGNLSTSRLERVAEYIQTNYGENISIVVLAQVSELHGNYLINAFRRRYGIPPHAYLTQVRIQAATREIQRGIPLVEAATRAGFYDQSHFHRHFRRIYCVTPGQYVAALRNIP